MRRHVGLFGLWRRGVRGVIEVRREMSRWDVEKPGAAPSGVNTAHWAVFTPGEEPRPASRHPNATFPGGLQ